MNMIERLRDWVQDHERIGYEVTEFRLSPRMWDEFVKDMDAFISPVPWERTDKTSDNGLFMGIPVLRDESAEWIKLYCRKRDLALGQPM